MAGAATACRCLRHVVVAVGVTLAAARPAAGEDATAERFRSFLADYRPKGALLYNRLYKNVECRVRFEILGPDGKWFDFKSTTYRADETRMIRVADVRGGEYTDIAVLRPEVNYKLYGPRGLPTKITHNQAIREADREQVVNLERWRLESGDWEGLGLGLVFRHEDIYTKLTDATIVVERVDVRPGAPPVTVVAFRYPVNPVPFEAHFHTDAGVCFKWVEHYPGGDSVSEFEYEMPDRTARTYVPKRLVKTSYPKGSSVGQEKERITVLEFREQTHFDDATFRLEQFGLPDVAGEPDRTRTRGFVLLAAAVGGVGVTFAVVRWLRRRYPAPAG